MIVATPLDEVKAINVISRYHSWFHEMCEKDSEFRMSFLWRSHEEDFFLVLSTILPAIARLRIVDAVSTVVDYLSQLVEEFDYGMIQRVEKFELNMDLLLWYPTVCQGAFGALLKDYIPAAEVSWIFGWGRECGFYSIHLNSQGSNIHIQTRMIMKIYGSHLLIVQLNR